MDIPKSELFAVLREFNPWWGGQPQSDLPVWERSAIEQIWRWTQDRETIRSLVLAGARQVGKTTLYRQAIRRLLAAGQSAGNILYATFDHPILKLAGIERTMQAWDELFPEDKESPRFAFLDEVQSLGGWQTWLKHQVDFHRRLRIAVTGSANPLYEASSESGVGRWETIPLPTLSFGEYLKLRGIQPPKLPLVKSLRELFTWEVKDFALAGAAATELTPHFHDYLIRGGFPEPALVDDIVRCQRLLREDIVEKVLKRDLTSLYGVRRILEVERIFLYLCYHDGGIVELATLARELEGTNKNLIGSYLSLFESTHLIYRLKPFGYGKEVLRGRDKVYLADASLPGSVLLLGRRLLEDADKLGRAVETAFFKHVFTRYYPETPRFSYWRDRRYKDVEVDLIAEVGDRIIPFEVKYQDAEPTSRRLKGMRQFLESNGVEQGYVITQRREDFGVRKLHSTAPGKEKERLQGEVLLIPAPLACYWLSG